jgi:hypothetical protein
MIYLRSVLLFKTSKRKALSRIICLLAFFVVLYQVFGESKDFKNYEIFFENARFSGIEYLFTQRFEPLFSFLGWGISSLLQNNFVVYGVLVFFSLWIKSIALIPFIPSWRILLLIAVFYGTRFFPLHELTQIRAALSSSFLLLAMKYSLTRHKKKSIFFSAISMGFHMSSSIAIPFVFLKKTPRRSYIFLISLGILATSLFLKDFLIEVLSAHLKVIAMYASQGSTGFGERINPVNSAILLDMAMIAITFLFWNKSTLVMRRMVFLQVIGLMVFWSFHNYAVLAHRWRELISVFWVFFFARALALKGNEKYIYLILCIINIVFYLHLFFFSRHAIF